MRHFHPKKIRKGLLVLATFWDHADGKKLAKIRAPGYIVRWDKEVLVLKGWSVVKDKDFTGDAEWAIAHATLIKPLEKLTASPLQ